MDLVIFPTALIIAIVAPVAIVWAAVQSLRRASQHRGHVILKTIGGLAVWATGCWLPIKAFYIYVYVHGHAGTFGTPQAFRSELILLGLTPFFGFVMWAVRRWAGLGENGRVSSGGGEGREEG